MPNPFDQFDDQAQPVPVQSLQPIIGAVTPEEQARKARQDALAEEAAARASAGEARSVAEFEGTGGKPTEAQAKVSTLLTRIQGGFQDIQAVRERNPDAQTPGLGETMAEGVFGQGVVSRATAGADRRIVTDAQRDVLDALLTLGTGAAYNAEQLEGQTLSYFPQFNDTPEEIATKNARLQRLIEAARVQAGPKWGEIEQAIAPFMSDVSGTPLQRSPLSQSQPIVAAGEGESFLTSDQQDFLAKFTAAYDSGATLEELQALGATPFATQAELDEARRQGRRPTLTPAGRDPRDDMSALGAIGETITGSERSTPEIEALPDWTSLPVGADKAGFLASLGSLVSSPEEAAQILYAQGVATDVRQDEKGNFILTGTDGKQYAIKPGFRASDIPRAVGAIAAFTPAGRATTLPGAFAANAGTQAGIELTQAASGGDFNAEEVLIAGVGGAGAQQLGRGINAVRGARAARSPSVAPELQPASPSPVAAADDLAVAPLSPEAQTEVGSVARAAIGKGKSAREAQEKLAVMAKINPEAKDAAERLGMELTPDILSDDTRLLTVTGLARSQAGSDAEAAWIQQATRTIEKADGNLASVGASRNLAGVSADVRSALQANMDELEAGANSLREEVNAAINVRDRVDATNLQAQLGQTINDLGGIEEAKQAFSAEEKKLLAMLGEDDVAKQPTYAMLDRLRNQIGEALFKGKGPWVDTEEATLKRYYGALAQDRLDYVASTGGKELADKMRGSNDLYSKMYDVRGTMQTLFGKQLEKDISNTVTQAITTGAKGQGKSLRTILDNVPKDMQAQTLLTGLMSVAGKGGPNGGFSFTKYAEVYRGLRENSPIYAEIAKTVGPDASRILQDLYSISKRMARAENAVIKTGKSNQPLLNALAAEGLVSSVAKSAAKRGIITGGSSIAGGVVGGPLGSGAAAGAAEALQQAFASGGKSNLDRLHGVLVSEPFKELVEKAGTGTVKDADINRVANDKAWRKYAATVLGIKSPEQRKAWLTSALANAQTNPDEQPIPQIEVR